MPGKNPHEGGRLTEGPPAEEERGVSKLPEPLLRPGGQRGLPQADGPEHHLLGEPARVVLRVPRPEMVGFAPEQPELASRRCRTPSSLSAANSAAVARHRSSPSIPPDSDRLFQGGEVLQRLDDAAGAGVPELRGLGRRREPLGELADQRVQPHAAFAQLLDQTDVVQPLQGLLEQASGGLWERARDTPASRPSVSSGMPAASPNCPATWNTSRACLVRRVS